MGNELLRPERVREPRPGGGSRPVPRRLRVRPLLAAAGAVGLFGAAALLGDIAGASLAALAIAVAAAVWTRPLLLGPLTALALPAGRLVELPRTEASPLEVVLGAGALGYLAALAARREPLRVGAAHVALGVFAVLVGLSTLGPADDQEQLRSALTWAALVVVFHAVVEHVREPAGRLLLLGTLSAAVVLEAAWALTEYVARWSERFSLAGGAIVYPLPRGTLEHPNALAQFLVVGGLAVLALAASDGRRLRLGALAVAAAAGIALVVTFSRASWLAASAGAAVHGLERRTRRVLLPLGAAVGALAAVLAVTDTGAIGSRIGTLFSGDTGSLSSFRLELAERAVRIAADHPLAGAGRFEEVGVYAGRPDLATHPHDLFLGIAVFFGIPAAVAFAAFVVAAALPAWRAFRAGTPDLRATGIAGLAVVVALLVAGLFEYPFWNVSLSALVALALGVVAGSTGASDRSSR